jgi:hypothetical protein
MHKGYKCLEPKSRRMYISRDVVFDQQIFPFEDLHENTGAKLRQEISLLPPDLVPSYDMFQVEQNSVQWGENLLPDEETLGETQNGAQSKPGVHINLAGDLDPIIGAEIQKYLHRPAAMMRDSDLIATATQDSPARTSHAPQGQVSSSVGAALIVEGSAVEQASRDGPPAHHDQEHVAQPREVRTRYKSGIYKPKVYTDGTIQY